MSRNPETRITRRAAEKALDGGPTTLPVVGELLAAARHTSSAASELPGEAQALASFRHNQAALPTRRGQVRAARAAIIAALSTKFVGAVAAVAAGGVVLAATTGVLPGTSSHSGQHPSPPVPNVSASPSPDLRGLCIAYRAGVARTPGDAIAAPAYTALASAAGTEPVADYCSRLLAVNPSTGHVITHPTGRPTTLPSQASLGPSARATSHPVGPPASLPASPQSSARPSGLSSVGTHGDRTSHLPQRP